jgi:hypothetical protein
LGACTHLRHRVQQISLASEAEWRAIAASNQSSLACARVRRDAQDVGNLKNRYCCGRDLLGSPGRGETKWTKTRS